MVYTMFAFLTLIALCHCFLDYLCQTREASFLAVTDDFVHNSFNLLLLKDILKSRKYFIYKIFSFTFCLISKL